MQVLRATATILQDSATEFGPSILDKTTEVTNCHNLARVINKMCCRCMFWTARLLLHASQSQHSVVCTPFGRFQVSFSLCGRATKLYLLLQKHAVALVHSAGNQG